MAYTNSPLVSYTKLSPNHSGQRTKSIDIITPHCVVGQCSVETLGNIFLPTSRQASCNYGIGADGRVGMYVEEKNRSWCSSSSANDQRAITIECASDATAPYAFKDVVYQKLIELCVDICKRNGKKKLLWFGGKDKTLAYTPASDEMLLTVHRWFANKSCPGDWMYARMGDLASKVTEKLSGSTETTTQTVNSLPSCPFTVQVLIDDLNIRTSAGMGNNLTGKVTGKGIFTIVEVKDGWGKLKSGAGWIYLENPSYCTIQGTSAPQETMKTKVIEAPATSEADPEKVWNFLSSFIGNDYGVAGLMGNLFAESALIANNLQNTFEKSLGMNDAQYTSRVDNETYDNFVKDSAGYGLAQWTYWSRKQALLEYADSKKASIGNLDMQLEFLKKEISANYASMLATLKSTTNVTEASTAVLTIYERPADQGAAIQAKRAAFGQKYFDQFHKEQKADAKYFVQVGAFSKKENADALLKKIQVAGFDGIIKEG